MKHTIVNRKQMMRMDKMTCVSQKITEGHLMDRVGETIANYLIGKNKITVRTKLVIVAGPGNNGGDAKIVAQILNIKGYDVTLITTDNTDKYDVNKYGRSPTIDGETIISSDPFTLLDEILLNAELIIDGLFGLGLSKPITSRYETIVKSINQSPAEVISIDMASGVDADTGNVQNVAVKADTTLAIGAYKIGHFLNQGKDYHGELYCLRCGIEPLGDAPDCFLIEPMSLEIDFLERRHDSHKYDYGAVVVFGGSPTMLGAAKLSALSALRSGAGLVSLALSLDTHAHYAFDIPEIIADVYEKPCDLDEILKKKNAFVYGVGLGKKHPEQSLILASLLQLDLPGVIDGDGLYYYRLIREMTHHQNTLVLTPHLGEFSAFIGVDTVQVKSNPLVYVKRFMQTFNGVLVLKGPTSLICYKDTIAFMAQGTPSLAKAGSGDVLSGLIAAMLAQGAEPFQAAQIGTLVHALAAQKAQKEWGIGGVIASDIIKALPGVIATIKR